MAEISIVKFKPISFLVFLLIFAQFGSAHYGPDSNFVRWRREAVNETTTTVSNTSTTEDITTTPDAPETTETTKATEPSTEPTTVTSPPTTETQSPTSPNASSESTIATTPPTIPPTTIHVSTRNSLTTRPPSNFTPVTEMMEDSGINDTEMALLAASYRTNLSLIDCQNLSKSKETDLCLKIQPFVGTQWKQSNNLLIVLLVIQLALVVLTVFLYFLNKRKIEKPNLKEIRKEDPRNPAPPYPPKETKEPLASAANKKPAATKSTMQQSSDQSTMENSLPTEASIKENQGEEKYSLEDCLAPSNDLASTMEKNSDARTKIRAHFTKAMAEHKSDTRSSKFKKMGNIFIPIAPEIVPPVKLPDNVEIDNVVYDAAMNEMFEVGSDVDSYEVEPPTTYAATPTAEETTKKTPSNDPNVLAAVGAVKSSSKVTTKSTENAPSSLLNDEIQI